MIINSRLLCGESVDKIDVLFVPRCVYNTLTGTPVIPH